MATLISNIRFLANTRAQSTVLRGAALSHLPVVEDAYVIVEGAQIVDYGEMKNLPYKPGSFAFHTDATGKAVLPSWCDSHTHLVFAGSREQEFVDKLKGLTYAEIAANGGGILHSAATLNQTSEDTIFNQSYARLQEIMKLGTGAIEIKSGYGLSVDGELKMLRVIKRLKAASAIPIKATFLGAHAVPLEFKDTREGYIQLLIDEMLPVVAKEKLADYIDVFCEQNFFTPEETERICKAGLLYGLKSKIHANQLQVSGGVQAFHIRKVKMAQYHHRFSTEKIVALNVQKRF